MRQRIWRRLFAAAVGLFLSAGAAAAQSPAARPAPGPTVPSVPAVIASTPVDPGPVVVTQGGPAAPAYAPPGVTGGRGYFMSGPVTETRQGSGINGCGSCKQDLAFVFGPCKTFFAPCGGLYSGHCGGHGWFGGGCGRGGCSTPVYGTGRHSGFDPWFYDSSLRH